MNMFINFCLFCVLCKKVLVFVLKVCLIVKNLLVFFLGIVEKVFIISLVIK